MRCYHRRGGGQKPRFGSLMGPWLWKELLWCVGARCRQSASPAALPCPAASLWFPGPAELLGSKPPLLGYQQWLPSAGGRGWYPRQWELSGTSRHRIARTSLTGPACEIMQAARHVKQCGCHSICKKQCCSANQHKINAAWSAAPRDPHAGAVGAQLCTVWLCTVQLCTLTPKSPEINLVGRDCGIVRASVWFHQFDIYGRCWMVQLI